MYFHHLFPLTFIKGIYALEFSQNNLHLNKEQIKPVFQHSSPKVVG